MSYRRRIPSMVAEQENLRLNLNNLLGDVYHPYGSACSQKQTDYA